MNKEKTSKYVEEHYDEVFLKRLMDFIRIPNLSPNYDSNFFTNGLIEQAVDYVLNFAIKSGVPGISTHVHHLPGKPPLVLIIYEGVAPQTVMVYGHLDKQPHLTEGWSQGLSPIHPVVRGDKVYGRGASDDGYVPFAAILSIKAALAQGAVLPRIVITLECEEESGSSYLLEALNAVAHILGKPDFLICLDSEAADYSKLWVTSSLKGIVSAVIRAEVISKGVHSGIGGGIVPESFSILRFLLDRIDDSSSGRVVDAFRAPVPKSKQDEAVRMAKHYGPALYNHYSWLPECGDAPFSKSDLVQMYLNSVWEPALAITGVDGMPSTAQAGNVLRPFTELSIALRIPPSLDDEKAYRDFERLMTVDVPCHAKISIVRSSHGRGYVGGELEGWVVDALHSISKGFFGAEYGSVGLGGSIPFLSELGSRFPDTQIIALGAMGSDSSAHNPDESLDIPYSKKFIGSLSHLLASIGAHQPN